MEGGAAERQSSSSSYTYWVPKAREDAAPLPAIANYPPMTSSGSPVPLFWDPSGIRPAFPVTVRNKKRVDYTYELTLKFRGEWLIQKENKTIKGDLDIPEFSFGELEDLQFVVRPGEDKDLTAEDKMQICKDLRLFSAPINQKLLVLEQELKDSE